MPPPQAQNLKKRPGRIGLKKRVKQNFAAYMTSSPLLAFNSTVVPHKREREREREIQKTSSAVYNYIMLVRRRRASRKVLTGKRFEQISPF